MKTPIRWGVLGTARIASKIAAAIHGTEDAALVAIASRSQERATAWGRRHEAARCYGSYEELLNDPEIDAVYIPLPPSMHCEWAVRAAEKGKHVLCEKPLAIDAVEALRMASTFQERGRLLMDGTMWVHSPRSADMLQRLRAGELGELKRVTAAVGMQLEGYLRHNPPTTPEGDDPAVHELRMQKDLGGGALLDLGWYCIGAAQWAFGDLPERVFGTARYRNGVDWNFSALLWYAGDRMASFDCGFDLARRKWFEIIGSEGSLVCDDFVGPWDVERQRFWIHDAEAQAAEHSFEATRQEQCMIARFCDILRADEPDPSWAETAVANQKVCAALERSARTEEIVSIS